MKSFYEMGISLRHYLITAISCLIISEIITSMFISIRFSHVSGNSMNPTIEDSTIMYGTVKIKKLNRNDVITFRADISPDQQNEILIKRVIGLPGETIQVKEDGVYINGNLLEENFDLPGYSGIATEEYIIPEDHYFVLGDNRPNSLDSRYIGPVPKKDIITKVIGTSIIDRPYRILRSIIPAFL